MQDHTPPFAVRGPSSVERVPSRAVVWRINRRCFELRREAWKYRRNMEVQEMEDGSNRKEEREEPHPLLW